jgi:hypothetical protein
MWMHYPNAMFQRLSVHEDLESEGDASGFEMHDGYAMQWGMQFMSFSLVSINTISSQLG